MKAFSGSVLILCCSIFIVSLIKILAPIGKTEKILKIVLGLFILVTLTLCVKTIVVDMPDIGDSLQVSAISEDSVLSVDESVMSLTSQSLSEYTDNLLLSEGIKTKDIKFALSCDENGLINISDIRIYINKTDALKASEIIENDFKIKPKVIYE